MDLLRLARGVSDRSPSSLMSTCRNRNSRALNAWFGVIVLIVPNTGALYNGHMRIIALKTLRLFWEQHPDAQQALQAWYRDAKRATWNTPADIKNVYRNASLVGNNRVVFNIRGNPYRLVVAVNDMSGIIYIRFIGTR